MNGLGPRVPLACECGAAHFSRRFVYDAPPRGETSFPFSGNGYRRAMWQCGLCRHFVSVHQMDLSLLYSRDYVTSTYGGDGVEPAFERIVNLPPARSDNAGRVDRILRFAADHFGEADGSRPRSVLDVGSGLCVFLHAMKAAGWRCTAVDPDARAARHAQERVGVSALCGDFMTLDDVGTFDLITFNKVLEHVWDCVGMLARARRHLAPGGIVYVEVPDGEAASNDGPGREEFFVEHEHVFSPASVALLATRAGFDVRAVERVREPSAKYTLRAFLVSS